MKHSAAPVLAFAILFLTPVFAVAQETPEQAWSIFAGTGQTDSAVTDRPMSPTDVTLNNVYGIEVSPDAIYFSTVDDHSIWKCDHAGTRIVRVAGTGEKGYTGDGGPALDATFNAPHEIRIDAQGNLFVADTRNHCIRRIDGETQTIKTIAGDGTEGFRGDGGPGDHARFSQPHSIVLDGNGGLLVADTTNHRLRHIDLSTRIVTTVSGDGKRQLPTEGRAADSVSLFGPRSLAIDDQSIWLVLREGNSVWRIDRKSNVITRVAGTGEKGHGGDGGDPLQATFRGPKGIAADSQGNLLIVDTENHAMRYVDLQRGRIETLPVGHQMKRPHGTAVLTQTGKPDTFFVSDSENHRVLAGHR